MPNESASVPVRVEVPLYNPNCGGGVKLWLKQVEICLRRAGVEDEQQKYGYLATALPAEIVEKVYDLIIDQPPKNPFQVLVARIRAEFEPSSEVTIVPRKPRRNQPPRKVRFMGKYTK